MLPDAFYQIMIYTGVTVVLLGVLLLAAWWLGARRSSISKGSAYESGIIPTASVRTVWPIPFYLVAIFFIVFDVEAAFVFTWAVVWDLLGVVGVIQITVFIVILAAGLVWLWLKGGLEWGPSASHKRERHV